MLTKKSAGGILSPYLTRNLSRSSKIARINLGGEGRACNALMAFKKVRAMATVTRALVI